MKNLVFALLFSLCMMAEQKVEQAFSRPLVNTQTRVEEALNSGKPGVEAVTAKTQLQVPDSKQIVKAFLEEVRSGKDPDKASLYLAGTVLAHQMNAEKETAVQRSPAMYANHVREFLTLYGNYTFEITELLAEGNKVYARWKQTGTHLTTIDGYTATGQPLVEIASAVYRVENGKIAEYWIQIDRFGLEEQLKQYASK
jgi:predicted ester cyclase